MTESGERESVREARREGLVEQTNGDANADESGGVAAPAEPVHVDGPDHLDELVVRYDVVLVDFYADWCGPCTMLEPVVAEVAAETDAAVAKVDVDANQGLAATYGVRGVPTLVVFADGEPVQQVVGVRGKEDLVGMVTAAAN